MKFLGRHELKPGLGRVSEFRDNRGDSLAVRRGSVGTALGDIEFRQRAWAHRIHARFGFRHAARGVEGRGTEYLSSQNKGCTAVRHRKHRTELDQDGGDLF